MYPARFWKRQERMKITPGIRDAGLISVVPGEKSGLVRIQQMVGSDDNPKLIEAVILRQYKIVKSGNETICLYDLQEDPDEEYDLSMTREGLLKKLMKQIEESGGFLRKK